MPRGTTQKSNRLSVYLIRSEFTDALQFVNNSAGAEVVPGTGTFYYGTSHARPPGWLTDFFGGSLTSGAQMFTATARGLLVVPIHHQNKMRFFAVPFGSGWHMIDSDAIEERFGLKVVLNAVDPKSLRSVDKFNLGSVSKQSREQLGKESGATAFGIDIEQDLIRSVTGRAKDTKTFGKIITGKDALSFSVPLNVNDILPLLQKCLERYGSDDYKTDFGWIDQIAEIKSDNVVSRLNAELVTLITSNNTDKVWMAAPEIVDWHKVKGFRYVREKTGDLVDDLDLARFLEVINKLPLSIDDLKHARIHLISAENDEAAHSWAAFKCIDAEIDYQGRLYVLNGGKWYEIQETFAKSIRKSFQDLKSLALQFPDCTFKTEEEYNALAATTVPHAALMDKNLIQYGGGHSSVEYCDLLVQPNTLVHVKQYSGSAPLSHLFAQAVTSGELLASDPDFRVVLNNKLPASFKMPNPSARPNPTDYSIVFGIISDVKKPFDLPFFSKVNLRNAQRRLEMFGYHVFLNKINRK